MLRTVGYPFQAVEVLEQWLLRYRRESSKHAPAAMTPAKEVAQRALRIAHILRQEFGNDDPAP